MNEATAGAHLLAEIGADGGIDISVPVTMDMVTWDDRFAPRVEWHSATALGDRTTNSTWTLNAHTGTHVDAALHHLAGGGDVTTIPLRSHIGRCHVLDLTAVENEIEVADLERSAVGPGDRLLLKTRNSAEPHRDGDVPARFDPGFVALSEAAAQWLVDRQVALVGTDGLGIEPYGRKDGVVHRILLGADVVVLEGLRLGHVGEGDYLLVFLPILLAGAEAAPGRAVLFPLDTSN